jgi:predicted acetyltransferase
VRGARARGVGTSAAHALFAAFAGRWEIRVRQTNVGAAKFWRKVAARRADGAFSVATVTSAGVAWEVLGLDSAARAGSQ